MMKYSLCLLVAALGMAAAATLRTQEFATVKEVTKEKNFVPILKSAAERKDDGSFVFSYEGADGSYREEVGIVRNAGTDDEELDVSGTYRYYDADGQLIEVRYTANKDGFVPVGTNIPQEISTAAKTAADFARTHPLDTLNEVKVRQGKY